MYASSVARLNISATIETVDFPPEAWEWLDLLGDIIGGTQAEALAHEVAEWLCGLARASDRDFAVCLSGGSTPRRLYESLASPAIASRFPWARTHLFWGDERFVPQDDPESNYGMVREALLSRVSLSARNIHAVPTEGLSPEQAAAAYEATLKQFYRADALSPARPPLRRSAEPPAPGAGSSKFWQRVGATPSCRPTASRPTTAPA